MFISHYSSLTSAKLTPVALEVKGLSLGSTSDSKEIAGEVRPRSRGRQPTFDRNEAVDIALDLFWRHGYDGVSVADLTKAIGIAAPSLYHAFGSKADLFREVVRRYNGMGLHVDEIADASTSLEVTRYALERGIAAVTRADRPPGCMVSSGLLMSSAENAQLAAELRADRAVLQTALERRIRRDIEGGLLDSSVDAAGLARFYASVLQGISVQAIDGASHAELNVVMKNALNAWPTASPHAARKLFQRDVSKRKRTTGFPRNG